MAVPDLLPVSGDIRDISPLVQSSPYAAAWWMYSTITRIPETAVGWLTANGWQVTGTYEEDDVTYYTMTRQSMNSWAILQTLLNQYTTAYNEGRRNNSIRYNDVIAMWNNAISVSRNQMDAAGNISDGHISLYVAQLDDMLDAVEEEVELAKTAMTTAGMAVTTQLAAYLSKLDTTEQNYTAHLAAVVALMSTLSTNVATYLTDYDAKITELESALAAHALTLQNLDTEGVQDLANHIAAYDTELDTLKSEFDTHKIAAEAFVNDAVAQFTDYALDIESTLDTALSDYTALQSDIDGILATAESEFGEHEADVNTLLALLLSDYTTHATAAAGYLTGLGATELSRINEQFNNLQAKLQQELINRGLYSSALITTITTRVERERSEAITQLNDRLNREKLENQHRMYGQQVEMRARTLDGKSRLHGVRQEVLRYQAESLSRLYGQVQELHARTISSKTAVQGMRQTMKEYQLNVEQALYGQLASVRTKTIEATDHIFSVQESIRQWRAGDEHKQFAELAAVNKEALEAIAGLYEANQKTTAALISQRDQLLAQYNAVKGIVLSGKERYSALQLQNGEFLTGTRHKLALMVMQAQLAKAGGRMDVRDREEKMMAYQLDTRNNLLVGLWGFIERREDNYPSMEAITKLVAGLGDSGGGWVTP